MSQFVLDYGKAREMQISNDAFFYLLEEEEPLDEDNLEEAQEIIEMFPHGYQIGEGWKAIEDSDLIQVTLVPYIKGTADYDMVSDLTKYIQLQLKWLEGNKAEIWWVNSQKCTRESKGIVEVITNKYGNKCFEMGKGSLFFMKHFRSK